MGQASGETPVPTWEIDEILTKELSDIYPKLLNYARKREMIIGGLESAEDIVTEALKRLLEGERKWYRESCPGIYELIVGIIRSISSDRAKKEVVNGEKIKNISLDSQANCGQGENDPVPLAGNEAALMEQQKSAEVTIIEDEAYERTLGDLRKNIGDDKTAQNVLICYEDGYCKPREIADLLEISVSEVNNAQKRIRRAAQNMGLYKTLRK